MHLTSWAGDNLRRQPNAPDPPALPDRTRHSVVIRALRYPFIMLDLLFANHAAWFTIPALLGTGIFLIKLVMMLAGGSDDLDLGGGASAGHIGSDFHGGHDGHGHGGGLMAIASVQGISAFMMGFGWAGLGGLQGLNLGLLPAMGVGVLGGVGMGGLFLALLSSTRKLSTSGNVNIAETKGATGEVYATVPASGQGRGQVKLVVSGRQRIVQAISQGESIATGITIKVVEVRPDNTVVVAPAGA